MEIADPSSLQQEKVSDVPSSAPAINTRGQGNSSNPSSSASASAFDLGSWTKSFKIPQASGEGESQTGSGARSTFASLTSGFRLRSPAPTPVADGDTPVDTTSGGAGVFDSLTKGLVDSSRSAVKVVQAKARHMVSQNKRRYQEGGFDLDLTYITENIIAMGFPAGDISSGLFGYVEGLYRNHMEEVIRFFETHHQAASFPFDDHNCPPIHLISSFCQSAYTWLKADVDNVVVVHCKAGLGRTGLMISSLLLYLKFCPTVEESIDLFNRKRCVDGKGLDLPSQDRYIKYFEHILKDYGGGNPQRGCMLRGFRLHKCPYWIRPSITISDHNGILFTTKKHPKTKDLQPEDFWMNSSRKGIVVFALPGEPGLTELAGDFKFTFKIGMEISTEMENFFYPHWMLFTTPKVLKSLANPSWFNTTMSENRIIINSDDFDGFDKRKLPSPSFQVELVMIDYDGTKPNIKEVKTRPDASSEHSSSSNNGSAVIQPKTQGSSEREDKDDVFSDSDGEGGSSRANQVGASVAGPASHNQVSSVTQITQQMSINSTEPAKNRSSNPVIDGTGKSGTSIEPPKLGSFTDFKAIAADASVFSFGDEDFESD